MNGVVQWACYLFKDVKCYIFQYILFNILINDFLPKNCERYQNCVIKC